MITKVQQPAVQSKIAGAPLSRRYVAIITVFVGWVLILISVNQPIGHQWDIWNSRPGPDFTTRQVIAFVSTSLGGTLLSPLLLALAGGTVGACIPSRVASPWLLWPCRALSFGLLELPFLCTNPEGWVTFGPGTILIVASAWLNPTNPATQPREGATFPVQPPTPPNASIP